MSKYDRDYLEEAKKLPGLFKEIEDIRYGRATAKVRECEKEEIKFNRIYVVNHKFNAIGAIIGILFLILFSTMIKSTYIFATTEEEKIAISEFEKNEDVINIMNTISNNISELTTNEIITREVDIEFETKYVENNLLAKDEQVIVQQGVVGKLEQNVILTYENEQLINEKILSETRTLEPVEEIIEIGTSEFLLNNQVHINDIMYTTKEIEIHKAPDSEEIYGYIYEYIDVILLSEKDGWAKILVDGVEGYIESEFITSETVTPGIVEKSRKKRIAINLNFDMSLNKPSGFSKEDFVRVLSNNNEDKNKIFEKNAELFYELEQKYNINGIFLASMGIHESNWGTSNIATQKKNLFGYGAYDSSAYSSSYTFESYEYCIEFVAKILSKYYLNEPGSDIFDGEKSVGTYYNGSTLSGVNTRYASDHNWANRIYQIMTILYEKL